MGREQFTVISAYPLGDEVSMVVFQDDETEERAVQLLPVSVAEITPEILQELLEWPKLPGGGMGTVTLQMDDAVQRAMDAWCAAQQVTFTQVAMAAIRFCTDRRYARVASPWLQEMAHIGGAFRELREVARGDSGRTGS